MRVHFLITDLEIGGTPRVVRELAIRLRPLGFETAVTCLAPWGPVADELAAAGVPVSAAGATGVLQLAKTVRAVREVTADADVIFSFLVHANTVAALANRGRRLPLIQSIQTTQRRPLWHWWVQGVAGRAAAKIVVPSPSAAAAARSRSGLPGERIVVIPNAVDEPSIVRRARENGPWRVGFVGRLDPVKRVPDLVAAVSLVPDAVLHIYGDGPQRATIAGAIRRVGLQSRSTLYGTVASTANAFASIDALVLPSDAEGFGLVLIEAMAAGVPVIATNVPGIRNVVHNEVNGLLVPRRDPAALAAAIERVRSDDSLRQRLIEGGAESVRTRYTWGHVLEAYATLLRGCGGA